MPTWGSLRIQIQQTAPGVSLDLIDGWLQARYTSVLSATDWADLKAHTSLQTQAAHQSTTDTVTATVGSAAVTGAGTTWSGAISGQAFYVPGDTVTYIATYVSATSLTLDRPYEGKSGNPAGMVYAGSAYTLMQNVYALPADCKSVVTVLDPITNTPLTPLTKDGLDVYAGPRTRVGYPQAWAEYGNTPETNPPVAHQIELFPPPRDSRGFPLEYLRTANPFSGENTSDSPVPFISPAVLLFGVRADCAVHLEKYTQATGYELQFEKELGRLLLAEHSQRRTKTSLKMANRFTRHRLARLDRGQGTGWRGSNPGGPN
jgi:hypothetical protein